MSDESNAIDTGCNQLRATVHDGIGTIVFDNPDKHNAMTGDMVAALGRVRQTMADDPKVRVVIVRGAGERAFVSGADINQLETGEIRTPSHDTRDAATPRGMLAVAKPALALIHGYCIGGGIVVALSADLRICADDAQFGIPAAKLGVGYPHEATAKLVALVGPGQTAELLLSGRRIDAAEALRIGLVNHVVSKDAVDDFVHDLAREIAANAPLAHVAHLRSIHAAVTGAPTDRAIADDAIAAAWNSADFREGASAFLERRTPKFEGR